MIGHCRLTTSQPPLRGRRSGKAALYSRALFPSRAKTDRSRPGATEEHPKRLIQSSDETSEAAHTASQSCSTPREGGAFSRRHRLLRPHTSMQDSRGLAFTSPILCEREPIRYIIRVLGKAERYRGRGEATTKRRVTIVVAWQSLVEREIHYFQTDIARPSAGAPGDVATETSSVRLAQAALGPVGVLRDASGRYLGIVADQIEPPALHRIGAADGYPSHGGAEPNPGCRTRSRRMPTSREAQRCQLR
jgi:hypothetical protein